MGSAAQLVGQPDLQNLAIKLAQQQAPNMLPPSGPAAAPVQLPEGQPDNLAINTPKPVVFGPHGQETGPVPPKGSLEGLKIERQRVIGSGSGIDQIQSRLEDTGFGQAHPLAAKLIGGLGQGLAKLGDVGLSAVAPALAINLPGTEYHHLALEHGLNKQIGAETGEQEKEAQTADLQAQAPLRAAQTKEEETKATDQAAIDQADISNKQAQTGNLQAETQGANPEIATYRRLVEMGMKPDQALDEVEKARALGLKPQGMEHVAFESGGRQMEGNYNPQTGQFVDLQGNVVKDAKPIPPPAAIGAVTMIAPDPNNPGGGVVQRLTPGQHVAPGSQTPAGVNTMNTPTTTQRTAAGRAETVISMIPEVLARIDATAGELGPLAGRWDKFMQGQVGAPDEPMAELRSDLLMMSSAVALAHAQGRLPENLREEFDRAINAPNQSPENLKGTIQTMVPWLQKVQEQGQRPGSQSSSTGGATFKVKLSDAMALPQNKGKSETDVEADVKKHGGEVVR
jgi:hypothetical protein